MAQVQLVEPGYATADGVVVRGWDVVIDAAYQNALLTSQQVLLAASVDAAQTPLTVDISLNGVTQLVIPESAVEKMKQTKAAYNFYIENIAVTVSAEEIASWEGEMDLNIRLRSIQNFSADFDAFYIQKNKKASVLDKAVINVALSAANAQSIAYVFGREAQNAYQLLNASPVSEIGTVTIQADTNQEYLILY